MPDGSDGGVLSASVTLAVCLIFFDLKMNPSVFLQIHCGEAAQVKTAAQELLAVEISPPRVKSKPLAAPPTPKASLLSGAFITAPLDTRRVLLNERLPAAASQPQPLFAFLKLFG